MSYSEEKARELLFDQLNTHGIRQSLEINGNVEPRTSDLTHEDICSR